MSNKFDLSHQWERRMRRRSILDYSPGESIENRQKNPN